MNQLRSLALMLGTSGCAAGSLAALERNPSAAATPLPDPVWVLPVSCTNGMPLESPFHTRDDLKPLERSGAVGVDPQLAQQLCKNDPRKGWHASGGLSTAIGMVAAQARLQAVAIPWASHSNAECHEDLDHVWHCDGTQSIGETFGVFLFAADGTLLASQMVRDGNFDAVTNAQIPDATLKALVTNIAALAQ